MACLLREEPEHSRKAEIVSRLQRFAETGDLAAIGRLRYVYARETGPGQSHVVAAWTEGSFDVGALLPPKLGGDTPGSDSRVVPRPADAVRLLTADVEGVPYAVRLYDAAGAPEAFMAGYEASLLDNGWSKVEGSSDPRARSYVRGPIDLMVVAGDHGARSMVSMVEMRPCEHSTAARSRGSDGGRGDEPEAAVGASGRRDARESSMLRRRRKKPTARRDARPALRVRRSRPSDGSATWRFATQVHLGAGRFSGRLRVASVYPDDPRMNRRALIMALIVAMLGGACSSSIWRRFEEEKSGGDR